MTKEEAIEVLHELDGTIYDTQQVALDMAIKALEQDVSDTNVGKIDSDCVSRAEVHKMLENIPITDCDKWFNWLQKACLRLAELPPVTPTQRWIPVSERLPDTNETVLCWHEYYHWGPKEVLPEYGFGYYFKEVGAWGGEVANGLKAKVLAWQPLPKPYEEK